MEPIGGTALATWVRRAGLLLERRERGPGSSVSTTNSCPSPRVVCSVCEVHDPIRTRSRPRSCTGSWSCRATRTDHLGTVIALNQAALVGVVRVHDSDVVRRVRALDVEVPSGVAQPNDLRPIGRPIAVPRSRHALRCGTRDLEPPDASSPGFPHPNQHTRTSGSPEVLHSPSPDNEPPDREREEQQDHGDHEEKPDDRIQREHHSIL